MSTDAASQHLKVSTAFGVIADSIPDWAAPSPVDAWTARDVVDHLLSWLPPLLQEATGIHLESPLDGTDPARQWRHRSAHIQAILENTSTASTAITAPRFAGMTVEVFIDRLYSNDVFMHTWDLAKASGQTPDMDPEAAQGLLDGLSSMDQDMLRAGGQYGPALPTASADSVDRLMAFIGRDPAWQLPTH